MSGASDQQVVFWNGPGGERWVREQELLDRGLRAFGDRALDAAAPRAGERVLDVGCGCGDTALTLADRVAPGGSVVGLDLSGPMLARARERAAGRSDVAFVQGDAGIVPVERASFDLLFSRFGVMFFDEPARVFAHLRGALKEGGRLAFVCWRTLAENPWARVPYEAAVTVCGAPPPMPADAPGPFAFGHDARVRAILGEAGFSDVTLTKLDVAQRMGVTSHPTLDDAVSFATKFGPAGRLLLDRDDETIARARAAIRASLAPYDGPEGVLLPAACWIVTARS